MQKRRFHSQNAGFEMSAPIGVGAKILAGGDVSPSNRSLHYNNQKATMPSSIREPWQLCRTIVFAHRRGRSALTMKFCFEINIILCRLPSHTSHKLQPCDVG